jgi:hypothetical protein
VAGRTASAGGEVAVIVAEYVAALRSVGIAARLGRQGQAELWTGAEWVTAAQHLLKHGLHSS